MIATQMEYNFNLRLILAFVFIVNIFLPAHGEALPFKKNSNSECIAITGLDTAFPHSFNLSGTTCLIYENIEKPGYIDLNIFSDVDLGEILVAESGNEQIYRVSNGVAKFGLSYDAELIRFDFMPNVHRANLVISAAVDYEQKLPRVTFVVTLKPLLADPNIMSRDTIAAEVLSYLLPEFSLSSSTHCNASNTSPVAPRARDASLNGNIDKLDFLSKQFSYPGLVLYFKNQVQNRGQWDFKQQGSQFEEYGNYHYGAVGASIGIPDQVLLRMAGWAQIRAGTSQETWGHYLGSAPYGDDPADQVWIQKGINYYKQVYQKLSDGQKRQNSDSCNSSNNNNFSSGNGGSGGVGGGTVIPPPPRPGWHKGGGPDCGSCHRGKINDL